MSNKSETISFYQFFQKFPDEASAQKHFETKRWGESVKCAHCNSERVTECKDAKPMPYRCKDCRKHFSVRTGTVLASSKVGLHKWLMAIYMLTTARKGIPSTQVARQLGVTQKTAWFLCQRIRETWLSSKDQTDLGDHVQVDEVYLGGKEKNKHESKRRSVHKGPAGKQAVVGIVGEKGQVVAKPIPNTGGITLKRFIAEHVKPGSTVVTDEYAGYRNLTGYNHKTVNHSVGEYIKDKAHTNGIESFWALLRRGYYGIYHYMSPKHLHRYVNEFSYRHSTSSVSTLDFIDLTISRMIGKRLTYRNLING